MIIKLNKMNQENNLILHYNTIKKEKVWHTKIAFLLNIINF